MRTIRRFKDNRNKSVRGVRVRVRTFTGSGHRRPFITTGVPVVRKTVVESQNRFFTTARVRTYGDFKLNRSVRQTAGAKPDLDLYVFFFFFLLTYSFIFCDPYVQKVLRQARLTKNGGLGWRTYSVIGFRDVRYNGLSTSKSRHRLRFRRRPGSSGIVWEERFWMRGVVAIR